MLLSTLFWILWFVGLIVGLYFLYATVTEIATMSWLFLWLMLFIVGWGVFGAPIKRNSSQGD